MRYLRAILRMSVFFMASLLIYGVWFVGSALIPNRQYWRQIAFRNWSRFFVWLSRMRVEVIGDVPRAPFFLVSNHLSYTDIPVLRSLTDSVFVAKGEIRTWFLAGKIVSDMEMIFIDRQNRRDIPRAGKEILEKLDGGEGVIVFPEGTSTKGDTILPFNSSFFEFAAQTDLPIQYAAITYRIDSGDVRASDAICWWGDAGFLEHLWKFFQVRSSVATVTFGSQPVVSPDRKQLAKELWNRVNERFIPVI